MRCVLLARSYAAETWTADEIQAALDCDPEWMTTEGADRLIQQLTALATDEDAGVRDEAQRILARRRPRENGQETRTTTHPDPTGQHSEIPMSPPSTHGAARSRKPEPVQQTGKGA